MRPPGPSVQRRGRRIVRLRRVHASSALHCAREQNGNEKFSHRARDFRAPGLRALHLKQGRVAPRGRVGRVDVALRRAVDALDAPLGFFPLGLGNHVTFTIHEPMAVSAFDFDTLFAQTESAIIKSIQP